MTLSTPSPPISSGVDERIEFYLCSPSGSLDRLQGERQLYVDIILKLKITTNTMYNNVN